MSRTQIFITYILINLAIVGIALWCYFHRVPASRFLLPVIVLFVLSGLWLIWATIRSMPGQK